MNTTITYAKGDKVIVTLNDDTTIEGTYVSTNSKGVNVTTADGKLITRAVSRVKSITLPTADQVEGYTTDELAEMFDTSARALRKRLRSLSMGVGKGRRYHLTDDQLTAVRTSIEGAPIED